MSDEQLTADETHLNGNGSTPATALIERPAPRVLADMRATLDALQTNVFVIDVDLTIVHATPHARVALRAIEADLLSAFGVAATDVVGGSIHRFHDDPPAIEAVLRDPGALPATRTYRFGDTTVRATANAVRVDGEVAGWVVDWEDVSEARAAQRRATEQAENAHAMTRVLQAVAEAGDRDAAVRAALDTVRDAFGWAYGSFWERDREAETLRFALESGTVTAEFRTVTLEASFDKGVGLSGRTWLSQDLVFERDLGTVTDCVRAPAARSAGVKSGVCFPVVVEGDVVGTMDFFALETLDLSPERLDALRSVGQSVSAALERVIRESEMARVQSMMDNAPTNMMFADRDRVLRYMNPASTETLRSLEAYLPVKADEMIGQKIDVFHKRPEHQAALLNDPANLPYRATIEVGPEKLDLLASAIFDNKGEYIGAMASWEVITEKLRLQSEMARVQSMMDNAPTNMMFADRDRVLRYMNPASTETLRSLEAYLPVKADEMIGQKIDVFHKRPEHQAALLNDPANLPYRATIEVGPEKLDLLASAIFDDKGEYIGAMASWEVITERLQLEEDNRISQEREREAAEELRQKVDAMLQVVEAAAAGDLTQEVAVRGEDAIGQMGEGLQRLLADLRASIGGIASSVAQLNQAATELTEVSTSMEANATETSSQANLVTESSKGVSANVEAVAAAAEEMTASIKEISQNTSHAAQVASEAVTAADTTTVTINKLGESSAEIGKIIKVITDIAQQTNLLALNATIEAARAGESGKGFAVVANEVKELAKETARATEDISGKIETIQTDTKSAVEAITEISGIIDQISEIQTTIASAVEEQAATTSEIARSVNEANQGSAEITSNIEGVATAAESTSKGAAQTQGQAAELTRTASELNSLVERFSF